MPATQELIRSGGRTETTMIVTIDGPAGGGKSTAAKNLARRLGIAFLDTGAMYRALTVKALARNVNMADPAAVERLLAGTRIEADGRGGTLRVLLDGEDVSGRIRTPEVTAAIGKVAHNPAVRNWMAAAQRAAGDKLGSVVTEGRDQGTVVFPDADVKFFIVCDLQTRARRRGLQFAGDGHREDEETIRRSIAERDREDEGRAVAPLRRPEDAVLIDTTDLTPEQTVDELIHHVNRCGADRNGRERSA